VHLERTVVTVAGFVGTHKEGVVVNVVLAPVDVGENSHVLCLAIR
jgi:hypothetical protein